ncbi:MAG: cytochrome c oxidase assembly protein [Gammaproteobacteria bacterium]|nr:cytochrome c oxidase assembly protein [Gammaproteobacteria bacterium]
MDKGIRNTILSTLAFMALILGLFFSSFLIPRPLTEEQRNELGLVLFESPRPLVDFEMQNQNEQLVNLDSIKGNWNIFFFAFTSCPDICPTTLSLISAAYEQFKLPVRVIMVTVDPERDSLDTLRGYLGSFNQEFIGYRGEFEETVKLAQQLNIAFGKIPGSQPGTYTMDHNASLALVDPNGNYVGFIKSPKSASNIQTIVNSL